MRKLTSTLFLAALLCGCQEKECIKLQFDENGEFKICQFTDLHLYNGEPQSFDALDTMRAVVEIEKPDLMVFTGDVVVSGEPEVGWEKFISAMTELKIPYVLVPGNHDGEIIERRKVLEFLVGQPYFVGGFGPEEIKGWGNVAIPIHDHATCSRVENVIWAIDSGDYPKDRKELTYYDYVGQDQIAWYRSVSAGLTKKNGGVPVPGLMFMHIPLPEFSLMPHDQFYYGTKGEEDCPSEINSGLFAAVLDCGDVMGVFAGHDHDNDYVGLYKSVALGFGRTSRSTHTYGDLRAGGRTFIIHEGEACFETWTTTPAGKGEVWYYPSGANSEYLREHPSLPALDAVPTEKGVRFNYYEGEFETTGAMSGAEASKTGVVEDLDISLAERDDWFGIDFEGFFLMPETGVAKFLLTSDDGAVLSIDGVVVLDNDGSHSSSSVEGFIALDKGFHKLQLKYIEHYADQTLNVKVTGSGFTGKPLSDFLYHE